MMLTKELLYDWQGYNEAFFLYVNQINIGEAYDRWMLILTRIGERAHFPYIMAGLLFLLLIEYGWRTLRKRGGARRLLLTWLGIMLVLPAAYVTGGTAVNAMKGHFAYPRPYVLIENARVLEYDRKPGNSMRSFPSGHAFFITLLVIGMWPGLSGTLRLTGLLLIIGVGWSRLAVGMHFPADVAGGMAVGLLSVLLTRAITYFILRKCFGLKC